jgi:sugar/nucleoside kinase (ribokinase family)
MVGLTRGTDPQTVLETACRLGAIVASHDGATPLLPQQMIQEFRSKLKA